jgi:hypothetical protein
VTNWGDWADEYYYIYPDGWAIRHFIIHGVTDEPEYSVTEPTLFSNPGEKPEDNIMLEAVKLANLEGEVSSHSYASWPSDGEGGFSGAIEDPVLSALNLKSTHKPVYIYEPGSGIGPYGGGRKEIDYSYSHFHSRNHWPVSQVPCDGRFVLAADRVTSSAITSVEPVKQQREGDGAVVGRFVMGLSDRPLEELVPFAKSWIQPPTLEMEGTSYTYEGYNLNERAFEFLNASADPAPLSLRFLADPDTPLVNPVLIVKDWGTQDVELLQDEKPVSEETGFRYAIRRTLHSRDLILWLDQTFTQESNIIIKPGD